LILNADDVAVVWDSSEIPDCRARPVAVGNGPDIG